MSLPVGAATILVDTQKDQSADGLCSLREAITALRVPAADCTDGDGVDDTIVLPAGYYELTREGSGENNNVDGDLDIDRDVTIRGADPDHTIIDGTLAAERVIEIVDGATVTIRNVTITGGSDTGGGGIAIDLGALTLRNVVVRDNVTGDDFFGGGILNNDTLVATETWIIGNQGGDGGGIFAEGGSSTTIRRSRIIDNSATATGAAVNNNGTLLITRSEIAGNSAGANGGAIRNAGSGDFQHVTFSANTSGDRGGAVHNTGDAQFSFVTATGNGADNGGGGIYNDTVDSFGVNSSILAGNAGGNCAGPTAIVSMDFNLEGADDCGFAEPDDQINTDPMLEALADNGGPGRTHALPAGSPAIDAGDATACAGLTRPVDQRFAPRSVDGTGDTNAVCDVGAFELVPALVVDSQSDGQDFIAGDGECATATGECTLRAAIQEANAVTGLQRIELPAGTYLLTIQGGNEDAAVTGDLDLPDSAVHIVGAATDSTVIDGSGLGVNGDRVFDVLGNVEMRWPEQGAFVKFSRLTITGGDTDGDGGGIRSTGVFALERARVSGNDAQGAGGGIALADGARALIADSAISGNHSAGRGGGIGGPNVDSHAVLDRVEVSDNTADFVGGGLAEFPATVVNSTISGNFADQGGGGIFVGGPISLAFSTVANNSTNDTDGGGLWTVGPAFFWSTIVAGNDAGTAGTHSCAQASGNAFSRNYNLEDGDRCEFTSTDDVVDTDPLLEPLGDNGGPTRTHRIPVGSPVLDSGPFPGAFSGDRCVVTDQRGQGRPQDGDESGAARCDRGAFELRGDALFHDRFEAPDPV